MKHPIKKIKRYRFILSAAFRPSETSVINQLALQTGVCPGVILRGLVRLSLSYGASDVDDVTHKELLDIIKLGKF